MQDMHMKEKAAEETAASFFIIGESKWDDGSVWASEEKLNHPTDEEWSKGFYQGKL